MCGIIHSSNKAPYTSELKQQICREEGTVLHMRLSVDPQGGLVECVSEDKYAVNHRKSDMREVPINKVRYTTISNLFSIIM